MKWIVSVARREPAVRVNVARTCREMRVAARLTPRPTGELPGRRIIRAEAVTQAVKRERTLFAAL